MDWYEETFRVTVVLVAASGVLAAPGFAGLGVSIPLFVLFAALAGLLFLGRSRLRTLPTVLRHDLGRYGDVLWLSPVVALFVCLLAVDATAGELQSLGGLVGLAGMLNYFLRPVYRAGYSVVKFATDASG